MKLSELRKTIREEVRNTLTNQHLNEAVTPQKAASVGFGIGPNSREKIDETSPEAVYIKDIADKLYNQGYPLSKLSKDKIVIAFIEGYVNSAFSDRYSLRYEDEKLLTMVEILTRLAINGYPPKSQSLGPLK
jgi:hypothetical protein